MGEILIVSAAADVLATLERPLREATHEATAVASIPEALQLARAHRPDLLLVDLEHAGSPSLDDRQAMMELAGLRLPVIALLPCTSEEQRVAAFESGIDDLVTKPFSAREVVLRIRAVLRRARATEASGARLACGVGPIHIDLTAHRAFLDGAELSLTALEFQLLGRLVVNAGRVQSRKELLASIWKMSPCVKTRTVDTHMKRLRKKLGAAQGLVETIRGVGYRLVPPGDAEARAPADSGHDPVGP
jgi:two-component system phosphate regulon response regulator PhoB